MKNTSCKFLTTLPAMVIALTIFISVFTFAGAELDVIVDEESGLRYTVADGEITV